MAFQYHRAPAVAKKISEIEPEKDARVQILGRVADKTSSGLVIDDSTRRAGSKQEVMTEPGFINAFEVGDVVRIFARVLPLERGFELRAEIIQDMNQLDMDLYQAVFDKTADIGETKFRHV